MSADELVLHRLDKYEKIGKRILLLTFFAACVILSYKRGYKQGSMDVIQELMEKLNTQPSHAPAPNEGEPGTFH